MKKTLTEWEPELRFFLDKSRTFKRVWRKLGSKTRNQLIMEISPNTPRTDEVCIWLKGRVVSADIAVRVAHELTHAILPCDMLDAQHERLAYAVQGLIWAELKNAGVRVTAASLPMDEQEIRKLHG